MIENHPELWKYFSHDLNNIDPTKYVPSTSEKFYWICQSCNKNSYLARPKDVFRKEVRKRQKYCSDCSSLERVKSSQQTYLTINGSLLEAMPEILEEWDFDKNEKGPEHYSPNSHSEVYFKCLFGHESNPARIYNKFNAQSKCPRCTIHSSEAEIRLYCEYSGVFKKVEWQKKIENIEVDIFLPELKIAIEVDGYPWHENSIEKDITKNKRLHDFGVKVFRVRDRKLRDQVENSIQLDISSFDFDKFCLIAQF